MPRGRLRVSDYCAQTTKQLYEYIICGHVYHIIRCKRSCNQDIQQNIDLLEKSIQCLSVGMR